MKIKNILITGKPRCGKTTLIKQLVKELNIPASGFFTEEIREKGERTGFKIVTLSGKEGLLAKKDINSKFKVSKYGVLLNALEEIGVKELEKGLQSHALIVIDEIGSMELFSEKFKKIVLKALDGDCFVLGTITIKSDPFCDMIKQRKDTKIFFLQREKFDELKKEVKKFLNQLYLKHI
ncbi:Hypothetical ATP-binding protein, containing DUF265 domain [Thermodesulfovibrio sp. N1]|uniref:nucleoside-triphosphatase n=1 Tax=unclassified Thermodesulfovibrio TaxID=2645936 RepID=UPI00083A68E1|nr:MULTISPECIES: nucleoside-triphosphatase [unclassified Thermodesulfovibrio]MDI1472589.1 nucleoside-triphosphatase [Thermodesulfovibrio sp. 1176]ODA44406.1 Hypothetical ATP-binding protein, containing DUF265 domain [Thermodesulfovibrio sp. N1]